MSNKLVVGTFTAVATLAVVSFILLSVYVSQLTQPMSLPRAATNVARKLIHEENKAKSLVVTIASRLFVLTDSEVEQDSDGSVYIGPHVAFVANGPDHEAAIAQCKPRRKFVVQLDGEPESLSTASQCDLVITQKMDRDFLPRNVKVMSLPIYGQFMMQHDISPEALLLANARPLGATEFAALTYLETDPKWEGVSARERFANLLQTQSGNRVTDLGLCANSDALAKFKFVIVFETVQVDGHISQQMTNALIAGAVPIYRGARSVSDHFNPKRFVNVDDFPDFEACVAEVLRLDADDEAFSALLSQPALLRDEINVNYFPLQSGGAFVDELFDSMPLLKLRPRPNMITSSQVRFVTFADGGKTAADRIMREAEQSQFFDSCTCFNFDQLPDAFKDKFGEYTQCTRGFGYWAWKPVVLCETLKSAKEGDLVVYCDSGCTISPHNSHKVLELFRTVLQPSCDLVLFSSKQRVCQYTKADLFATVGLPLDEVSLQVGSGVVLVRKTETSVKLMEEWAALMSQDFHNIDDSPSVLDDHPLFVEHRYDRSCLDLLARGKEYKFLFISHENLFKPPVLK